MNQYVTGSLIKELREGKNMTQAELARKLCVTEKAVSKWETGKGYPDITIIEDLAKLLQVSVAELMSGNEIKNQNKSFNMSKIKFYVCPICGNIITATGETSVSCHGITLPALEIEECDDEHQITLEKVEDEYYVIVNHEMSKEHYISFVASIKDNSFEMVKLYPESMAECRFKIARTKYIYFYCNRHGLYGVKI